GRAPDREAGEGWRRRRPTGADVVSSSTDAREGRESFPGPALPRLETRTTSPERAGPSRMTCPREESAQTPFRRQRGCGERPPEDDHRGDQLEPDPGPEGPGGLGPSDRELLAAREDPA